MPLYTKQVSIVLCCCVYLKEYAYSEKSNIEIKTYCACAMRMLLLVVGGSVEMQTNKKKICSYRQSIAQNIRTAFAHGYNERTTRVQLHIQQSKLRTYDLEITSFFFASSSPLSIYRPFVGACGRRN